MLYSKSIYGSRANKTGRKISTVARRGARRRERGQGSCHMAFRSSCRTPDPPNQTSFCLSRRGAAGSSLHWAIPLKRGVCTFIFTCLPSPAMRLVVLWFVDFSQGLALGTRLWDRNQGARVWHLVTSLFSGGFTSTGKKRKFIEADFLDDSAVLLIGDL